MGDSNNSQKLKLDPATFTRRLHTFINNWQDSKKFEPLWKSADGVSVVLGKPTDDDPPYRKSSALHNWLLGYEFPETILVFCERELFVLASQKKIQILEPLQKGMLEERSNLKLTCLTTSQEDGNKANFKTLIDALKASKAGKSVGVLTASNTEKMVGPLAQNWEEALKESGLAQVDVRSGLADIFAYKDAQEAGLIKQAADISAKLMERKLISTIEEHIDQGSAITHNQLAEQMDDLLDNPEKLAELLKNPKLQSEVVEGCYTPIIQSGGKYNLSFSAANNDDNLHSGTIVCSIGARYRSYCANVARTLFVDPKREVEQNYKHLLDIFNVVVKTLKAGNKMSQTMEEAAKIIQKQCPQLSNKFVKSCGSGIGIEFSELYGSLSAKNPRLIKAGMVFNVTVGFSNIELQAATDDAKNKTYSILLSDTVLVTENGPDVLTKSCSKDFGDISYSLEEPDAKPPPTAAAKKTKANNDEKKSSFAEPSRRTKEAKGGFRDEETLKKHQQELAKRFAMKREWDNQNSQTAHEKDVDAYSDPAAYPPEAEKNKVYVDVKRETVLIPIYGTLVPFHITKIKNASKADDMLRINFSVPNLSTAHGAYVKEISIRVGDQKSLNNNLRLIKELRKRVQEKEQAFNLKQNLVEQPKLILSKQRQARLMDLYIRPNISGRRTAGVLELHTNGFRFITNKNVAVDILYANIKHALFQPSESELIILLHFHLHNAIMIGKKKVTDVQFYSEVLEGAQGLDSGSRSYDRDEIEDEQREAEIRAKLDREFQNFIKKAEDMSSANNTDIEFDIPYRELGFFGVPGRSSVFLQPTVHSLVSLVETPFFVLTLNEIEICHCERVQFGLRNFDMVFVHKDLKTVSRVNNVPMESLETIKEWLDSCNIKFYEGPTNLNWAKILSTIREDVEKFYNEDGAWKFLEDDDDDGDEESDSEDAESDYEDPDSDEEGSGSESDSEDYESEASEEDQDEDDDEDEDEEGDDWDELERKAAAHDKMRGSYGEEAPTKRKRGDYSDSDDDRPKKKAAPKAAPKNKS